MITEQDLAEAIAECIGKRNPDANTCIKLAAYYTIMRELYGDKNQSADAGNMAPNYSYAAPPADSTDERYIDFNSESEFSQTINGLPVNDVLAVLDELMETLKFINTKTNKLYREVMRKLKDI